MTIQTRSKLIVMICKIDIDCENRSMRITQPVLLQSFKDEFELATMDPVTPITVYCSAARKLLPRTRWSSSKFRILCVNCLDNATMYHQLIRKLC